jgi:hypothetical protein
MSLGETKPKSINQKGRKKRRKGILTSLPQWQWSQLNAIIDAEIKNRSAPNPPRIWKEKFGRLVSRYGGASAWARAQEEYSAVKKLKTNKLSKRARQSSTRTGISSSQRGRLILAIAGEHAFGVLGWARGICLMGQALVVIGVNEQLFGSI